MKRQVHATVLVTLMINLFTEILYDRALYTVVAHDAFILKIFWFLHFFFFIHSSNGRLFILNYLIGLFCFFFFCSVSFTMLSLHPILPRCIWLFVAKIFCIINIYFRYSCKKSERAWLCVRLSLNRLRNCLLNGIIGYSSVK